MTADLPDMDTITWREMVARTASMIGDRTVARWLCEHASGCDRDEFDAIAHEPVSARSGLHLEAMVRRLAAGEPVQYVMGRWAFRRLDLHVDRRVLIPRPETELLVEKVLAHVSVDIAHATQRHGVFVDLGTGSGAIGLSLLAELPAGTCTVWMTDASTEALDVARANAAGLGVHGAGARFAHGSWYGALAPGLRGTLGCIVSNPPYIAAGDPMVEESVRAWEPHEALFAGADGLDAVRLIVGGACEWLAPGGLLALEIGHDQGNAVADLMVSAGLVEVRIERDLAGLDRCALGLAPSEQR